MKEKLKELWEKEEQAAYIHGWDFSYIDGRCHEAPLPWDYKSVIQKYINPNMKILDYDTGEGEFLLTLNHPYANTSATEGYPPNVKLCKERLTPLGIDFKSCDNPSNIPFEDESFDLIINRHGSFDAKELYRLLKKGGMFITQQVGDDNDRELVELLLPKTEKPFPHMNLKEQSKVFQNAGFEIIEQAESFTPIQFSNVGALVWFARIIQWEFPDFSVDKCFDRLLKAQSIIDKDGYVEGKAHRYLIVAKKK